MSDELSYRPDNVFAEEEADPDYGPHYDPISYPVPQKRARLDDHRNGLLWRHTVDITANRSDEEPHRLARLRRLAAWLSVSAPLAVLTPIRGLHDHKGTLGVTWGRDPTAQEQALVEAAWGYEIEYTVEHYVRGRLAFQRS